ncbi:MAG TPA: TetR/AcrR family transcriptional regulator [Gammaproteobacteria bacterium]|nr:TetR/AcrR family transcriptional regulator [Gammaproteobacteria bacterium]
MSKGQKTRADIISKAFILATYTGFESLSLSELAAEVRMTKGGLFAHFQSKEKLELEILEFATQVFLETVIAPAKAKPPGEARLRELFEGDLRWLRGEGGRRTCLFTVLAQEFHGKPGAVRDFLAAGQVRWKQGIASFAREAIEVGYLKPDLDLSQFAFEFFGIGQAYQHSIVLLKDPDSASRAYRSFEGLLARSRV